MTRILHLITRYLNGGSEVTTQNTLEGLAAAEEDYYLFLGTGTEHNSENLRELETMGVETTIFHSIRHYNPITAIIAVFAVAWFLWRENIDVIHTHGTEAGVIGPFAGTLAGTSSIIPEIHGDPVTADRTRLLNLFLIAVERLSVRLSDRIIVKSDRIREIYLDRGIGTRKKYELIYHGVDTKQFRVATPKVRDGGDDQTELLFVGRVTDGKGLFDLLDALERLVDDHDVNLQIAGDGYLTADLRAEIKSRDLPADLLGYREDVSELMATADVLVLPSYREGTPRVITEAMASGLPVVATDIAGIPEQVADSESGYLVPPGDVDALTNRLAMLVNDPEIRSQFGAVGRERAEKFDVERAKAAYRELYRSL